MSTKKMRPSSTKRTYQQYCVGRMMLPPGLSLEMQLNLKQLKLWFSMWHDWQKRIVVCRIVENCPKSNLELLATALEPILHLDFSTTLSPLMAALHHEGSRTFRIQRAADYSVPTVHHGAAATVAASEPLLKTNSQVIPQIFESTSNPVAVIREEPSEFLLPPLASKPDPVFLPTIQSTHSKHKTSPASSDIAHSTITYRSSIMESSPLHRSYNSVPDIRSSVDLLNVTKQLNATRRRHRDSRRSLTSINDKRLLLHKKQRQLELYKIQLNKISQWMKDSQVGDIATLLLDLIKMSDKALLGYLVQCLYHKLQVKRGLDGLSDKLLLRIFSYLSPASLLRCRMVCLQWYYLAGSESLWKRQCAILGSRESIGDDLVDAIEAVHKITGLEGKELKVVGIDWLQAYKDLLKLIDKMKLLVKKSVEERTPERLKKLTSAQLRSTLTLRELLDTVKASSRMSTQEAVLMAPESTSTKRRRLRVERNLEEAYDRVLLASHQHKEDTVAARMQEATDGQRNRPMIRRRVSLLDCGVDKRPVVPSLPNPDGIECLVLAGLLLANETPRPGKVAPIPTLYRIKIPEVVVMCLECDERKIVAGCSDRLIRVYDIRSGRPVSVLQGHKGSVQCLQFDDHNLVSGSWDTTCIVWDVVHFSIVKVLIGHTDCISCLQFHESTLITGSYDHSIKAWDMASWECLLTVYPAHKKPITCVSFNGLDIFSGSEDKTVKVWDSTDGSRKALLKHTSRLTSMVLSKLLLITACGNGELYLWDLRHMTTIMHWQATYNTAFAAATSLSMNRGKVYAAASDSIVYEWDIATGTCVRNLQGHSAMLTSVWAGNNRIVTSAEDNTISVWNSKKINEEEELPSDQCYEIVPVTVVAVH